MFASAPEIEALLNSSVVRVLTEKRGTGFFVAPGRVLTCAHVVEKAEDPSEPTSEPIRVEWHGQVSVARVLRFCPKPDPDLALLEVEWLEDSPIVHLGSGVHIGDSLYTFGYKGEDGARTPITFEYEGTSIAGTGARTLKVKSGQAEAGLSGSPVLNWRTRSVCGLLRTSRDIRSDLGAGVVPTEAILAAIPELVEFQREVHRRSFHCVAHLPRDVDSKDESLRFVREVAASLHRVLDHEPTFAVPVRKYRGIDQFLTRPEDGTEVELVEEVFRPGNRYLMLHGSGGSGKTHALRRLALTLSEQSVPVIMSSVRKLEDAEKDGTNLGEISEARLFELVLKTAEQEPSLPLLEYHRGLMLLVVDEFNEISRPAVEEPFQERLLRSLNWGCEKYGQLKVIIADRLNVRREAIRYGYVRLGVNALNPLTVSRFVPDYHLLNPGVREILRIPFFLNLWSRRVDQFQAPKSKADMLKQALMERGRVDENALDQLGRDAYEAYVAGSEIFEPRVGQDTIEKLREAGFVRVEGSRPWLKASWQHQLFHDYLAAYHVARRRVIWDEEAFDALSLSSQGYEAVQLASEELSSRAREEFLIKVYDWSWGAAAICLAEDERFALTEGVEEDLRLAILCAIAEKQWDVFPHSAESARRTLGRLPVQLSSGFVMEASANRAQWESQLRTRARECQSRKDWFKKWQALFGSERRAGIEREELKALVDTNPLVGWAAANWMRRGDIGEEVVRVLGYYLDALEDRKECRSARWRIAHVLGRVDTVEAVSQLAHLVEADEYGWVKYGATRSLVEIGWRRGELREGVFSQLGRLVADMPRNCRSELLRSFEVGEGSVDWRSRVVRLIDDSRLWDHRADGATWSDLRTRFDR
jgi:Trypsin-like peptidase domain